jgi:Leucine-rich repeat (LRR) protein
VWNPIPNFAGTRADWDAVCTSSGDELACDGDGRVILIHVKQLISLYCPLLGLPSEFSDLLELSVFRMDDKLKGSGGIDLANFMGPLLGLTNLREISLSRNRLTGSMLGLCDIISFAASATKLEMLKLDNNALVGRPAASLDCLIKLNELDVSHNGLTGQLPDTWADLGQLKILRLSYNEALGGTLPTAWFIGSGGMNKLKTFEAERCALMGAIPTDIGALEDLEHMILENNVLTGPLPASVASLVDIRTLNIKNNRLSGSLPANLFTALTWLTDLDISYNRLNGSIPQMSTNWPMVRTLDLSNNYLEGSIPLLGSLGDLQSLVLANNLLNGSIPDLSALTILDTIQLQHNRLSGALPDMSNLRQLTTLDASVNLLTSGLGSWLGSSKLTSVNLARNLFTGQLPATICGRALQTLDLRGNNLWGTIPESIGNCDQLKSLHLGAAVHRLGSVSSGQAASLPSAAAMAQLVRLTELSFAGLGLAGTVPASLFALPALRYLDLSYNDLTGTVPDVTAGGLQQLISLDLESNNLTGVVPASLLTLPRLLELLLADNHLTGIETPTSSSSTIFVTDLHLAGNNFSSIPAMLQNMTDLTTLDLSGMQLAGSPPAWLGQLQTLKVLRLSNNNLQGPLTDWLNENHRLIELKTLALDGNIGITGPLTAAAIRLLAKLQTLNLNDVGSFGAFPDVLGEAPCISTSLMTPLASVVGIACIHVQTLQCSLIRLEYLLQQLIIYLNQTMSLRNGIPEASFGALTELSAARAGFTGQLPPRLFEALTNLERLDLRGNMLTGSIPSDTVATSGGGGSSRRMLLQLNTSSPVLTHSRLFTLLLSDNTLHGLIPALPTQLMLQLDLPTAINLTNAAGMNGFACPLPSTHAAYASASCTCAAGRSVGAVQGIGAGENIL